MRTRTHVVLTLAATAALSGCAGGSAEEPAVLEVVATDDRAGGGYAFTVPATVEAGATRMALRNTGAEPHHAQLFRLTDGTTMGDVEAALASDDPTALFAVGVLEGGTGAVDPAGSSTAEPIVELTEGTYALLCFIDNDEGPHVAQGMIDAFEVTAAEHPAALPGADAEVELVDYGFVLPDELVQGATLDVRNASSDEPHEVTFLRVAQGAGTADVLEALTAEGPPAGPPPFSFVGGVNALAPEGSQRLVLDVEPGEYVLVCFIPSFAPANAGRVHAELGMVQDVTVG